MQYQPRARLPKHRRPFTVVVEQLEDRLVPGETLTGLLFLPGDLSPQDKLKELIVFSVSEQYFALRKALGIAVG